jgi:hypothetical protein
MDKMLIIERETASESFWSDLFSTACLFAAIILSAALNQGVWTVVCLVLWITFMFGKIPKFGNAAKVKDRIKQVHSWKEATAYCAVKADQEAKAIKYGGE